MLQEKDFKQIQREFYNSEEYIQEKGAKQAFVRYGFNFLSSLKELKNKKMLSYLELDRNGLVLDVGCNDGFLLNRLKLTYKIRGVGIDLSWKAIKSALDNNIFQNIYFVSNAEEFSLKNGIFDYILNFDVLEHLENPDKCVSEISRVLKKNGRVLIYVINKKDKFTWHWVLRKLTFNRLGVDKDGGHDWNYFLYSKDLKKNMEENGLRVEKIVFFHSFFTLIFDETIPQIFKKIWRFMKRRDINKPYTNKKVNQVPAESELPRSLLRLYTYFLQSFLPILEFMDSILSSRGYSNGFYVLGRKVSRY
jgi:2-polyprenyl-3-methyl-5-hydroxy-6-metoxy-1,4-benzoquinol methylase